MNREGKKIRPARGAGSSYFFLREEVERLRVLRVCNRSSSYQIRGDDTLGTPCISVVGALKNVRLTFPRV